MAIITFRDVLSSLDGKHFAGYRALLEAVRHEFNRRILEFPPGFTHFDVLERGIEKDWIKHYSDDDYFVDTGVHATQAVEQVDSPMLLGSGA